jgi:predicted nucleic acid-binding protein
MAAPVYFDTSVFIDMFAKKSKHTDAIRELLQELKQNKVRIYTSILTVQEISVLSFRRGTVVKDNHAEIAKLARIWGLDKEIALTAAKREAEIRDLNHENSGESEMKQKRRWDCIHIATAQVLQCSHLYTTDTRLMKRKRQLSLDGIDILEPNATSPLLQFPAQSQHSVLPVSMEPS